MKVLVTGAAGFIGFHLSKALLSRGCEVVGVDNISPSYDPKLKSDRLGLLKEVPGFQFFPLDLAEKGSLEKVFGEHSFEKVFHLAAHGGVAASSKSPDAFLNSNIAGFLNVLELCRLHRPRHIIYASSSSVYGGNTILPNAASQAVDHPLSFYAVTKRANELMAHSYSHLYQLPTTGLRFFTVYGPWGRPDMAIFKFTSALAQGQPVEIFGDGSIKRDFTYIDDAIAGILAAADSAPAAGGPSSLARPDSSAAPFRIYNLGFGKPCTVIDCLDQLERITGKSAQKKFLPAKPEDMHETHADITAAQKDLGFSPKIPLPAGLEKFYEWYCGYYKQP